MDSCPGKNDATESLLSASHKQFAFVHKDNEDEFSVQGFKKDFCKTITYHVLCVLSVGIVYLIGYWYPVKRMTWTHNKSSLKDATVLLITATHGGQRFVSSVKITELDQRSREYNERDFCRFELMQLSQTHIKYFEHMFLRYYFNQHYDVIFEFSGLDNNLTVRDICLKSRGTAEVSLTEKLLLHGMNCIDVPVRAATVIFFQLALKPFYIFQLLSLILWCYLGYWYYGCVIVGITLLAVSINTYQTKQYLQKLHDMVAKDTDVVVLQRNTHGSEIVYKSSRYLVPGDVIVIPAEGMHLPCDAVLLNGRCIVNESSLTGESFPVTKTPIDSMSSSEDHILSEFYSVSKHKRHTLYNGTNVVQARCYGDEKMVKALVIRTGFCTSKGRLIRSIIYPKPVYFTFLRDSFRFMALMACFGILGFIYNVVFLAKDKNSVETIILKALSIFTVAIPPSLPAISSVGLMYALRRLRKNDIFCIDPDRVNICGKIKLFVFDKTGTLTEDTLAVSGVLPMTENHAQSFEFDRGSLEGSIIVKAMATCHSLAIVKDQITGDPVDMSTFRFTTWSLREPTASDVSMFDNMATAVAYSNGGTETPNHQIALIKQYPFESSLQRMSVIAKEEGDKHMTVYTKGSPEMIMSMCNKKGVPENLLEVFTHFTKTGRRVLAIASKRLAAGLDWNQLNLIQRSDIESDLTFLGLIIFDSVLKPVSKDTIGTLHDANIRTVMATGDNIHTALSVAKEVGIIQPHQYVVSLTVNKTDTIKYSLLQVENNKLSFDNIHELNLPMEYNSLCFSLALTGDTYMKIREALPADILPKVLLSGKVFARMSPDQKTLLIEDLKQLGYGVGMCGDGANDCGALKAAHAGIALSDTEASVASPFTSKVFDISCVPQLLKEGRAALVSSYSTFKYVAYYSAVQYIGILILLSTDTYFSNLEFLYQDLFLGILLAFLIVQTRPKRILSRKRPTGRLVHPIFIIGFILQILIQFAFQYTAFVYVRIMPWYEPPSAFKENAGKTFPHFSYENSVVVLVGFFQYIWMSVVCIGGEPHLISVKLNWKYLLTVVVLLVWTASVVFYMPVFIQHAIKVVQIPNSWFIAALFGTSIVNLLVSYLVEKVLLPSAFMKRLSNQIERKTEPRNRYKQVYNELKDDENWPPVYLGKI